MPLSNLHLVTCLALILPLYRAAPTALNRRLLQTCPGGQTLVNGACFCNPGTRDGKIVNPLMLCNGNNTLCPWTLWRGAAYRYGHISGAFWPFQHFNFGVDDNVWSTFQATCSTATPAEVTIDMQTQYRIASMHLWAGVTYFGAVPGMVPDNADALNLAHTSNMDIRMGNTILNMTTCYSSGTLAAFTSTFVNTKIPISSCNNITARYINISLRGNGAGICGFRELEIRAFDPTTISTCQECPANKFCTLNQTFDCPLAFPSAPVNSSACICPSNMVLNGTRCMALPGFIAPFVFTFDSSLVSPYPLISSSSTGKIQSATGSRCFSERCIECWWGPPPYGRIEYSSLNSFEITVGFHTFSAPTGMQADNIIRFYSPLAYASASTWQPSGGYTGIDLARGYGASTATVSFRSNTPTFIYPWLNTAIDQGPIQSTRYHWSFVLNKTTLTMYINGNQLGTITGIVWGGEYPKLSMFGGNQFYDSLTILPVALPSDQIIEFAKDSLSGKNLGGFPCMSNFYCMNDVITPCPGNLVSPPRSSSLSNCSCRQPDMKNFNDTHCICNTFRRFNDIALGVCQNCPGSATYLSCPVGHTSTYTESLECSDYLCTRCLPGFFNNVTNVTACAACPLGTFASALGATVCTRCGAGFFANQPGSSVCTICPPGAFTGTTGTINCTSCQVGKYALSSGQTDCTNCEAGKFSTFQAGTTCVNCLAGTFSSIIGSSINSCQNCTPGTFSNAAQRSTCTLCSTGTFTTAFATVTCPSCPAGKFTNITGQSICFDCQTGTFSAGATSACTRCAAGTFMAGLGASLCIGCRAGTFSNTTGLSVCFACPPGTFSAFTGFTVCSNCSTGFFNQNNTASICSRCSADTYSDRGSSTCTACSQGSEMTTRPATTVLFVADRTNYVIRQVSLSDGSVTTVAGSGSIGYANGMGRVATFTGLGQIALSYDQQLLYIVDNFCVRSMTTVTNNFTVRTVVGLCGTSGETYGSVSVARLLTINAICTDPDGAGIYIAGSNRVVYFEFHTQTLSQFVGSGGGGDANGIGTAAVFFTPRGLYMSNDKGFMLISIFDSSCIFHVNMTTRFASRIIGTGTGSGSTNGIGTAALLNGPKDITMNSNQSMAYVMDQGDNRIRTITFPQLNVNYLSLTNRFHVGIATAPDNSRLFYVDSTTVSFYNLTSTAVTLFSGSTTAGFVDGNSIIARYRSLSSVRIAQLTSTSCVQCTAGKFRNILQTQCTDCVPGSFTAVNGSTTCIACPTGTYASAPRSTACIPAPIGFFTVGAASFYTPCPPGSFATAQGSSVCTGCAAGSYLPSLDSTSCILCSAGDYSLEDATSCSPCIPGVYSSSDGATTCLRCPAGSYSVQRATGCLVCTKGTYSLSAASACIGCSPGNYTDSDSATACLACQPGLYSPSQQATQCLACATGTFSFASASACLDCNPGYFASTDSAPQCQACPSGSYVSTAKATECLLCPQNTQTLQPAAESLLDCRCLPGFVCSYTKRINVRLTLSNITWDMLNVSGIANSPIIDAIALAAGVPRENVIINGILTIGPDRRMMRGQFLGDVRQPKESTPQSPATADPPTIFATVLDATTFNSALATALLDPYHVKTLSWTHGHTLRVARERESPIFL